MLVIGGISTSSLEDTENRAVCRCSISTSFLFRPLGPREWTVDTSAGPEIVECMVYDWLVEGRLDGESA